MAHLATAARAPVAFAPAVADAAERTAAVPAQAGWYADPEGRSASRFFDGDRWTEHTRGPAPQRLSAAPTRAAPAETRFYGAFENRSARASLVLGAVSLVLNPLFLPSLVALVLGVRGVRRSRASITREGRGRSLAGIGLSLTGVLTGVILFSVAVPLFLHAQHEARVAEVRSAIAQDAAGHGFHLASLTCPPLPDGPGGRGGALECRAATTDRAPVSVDVRLGPDGRIAAVAEHAVKPQRPPKHPPKKHRG